MTYKKGRNDLTETSHKWQIDDSLRALKLKLSPTGRMSAASDVSEEIDFGRSAKEALYAMIAQDKDPKIIRIQAQLVQSFRDEITSNSAETPIEYAEQTLLRLIKERKDPKDIKLQAQIVRDLEKLISSQSMFTFISSSK